MDNLELREDYERLVTSSLANDGAASNEAEDCEDEVKSDSPMLAYVKALKQILCTVENECQGTVVVITPPPGLNAWTITSSGNIVLTNKNLEDVSALDVSISAMLEAIIYADDEESNFCI